MTVTHDFGAPSSAPPRVSAPPRPRQALLRDLDLFWVSAVMLFFEILLIRWLSAEIRIFSYLHNLVLLFAFLGIGLGAALARWRANLLLSFGIMALLALVLRFETAPGVPTLRNISILLSAASDFVMWYGEPRPVAEVIVPMATGSFLLLLTAVAVILFFVPFGQRMGRLFDSYERPLRAYGVNIGGSLAGIWLYNGLAFLFTPPAVWFTLGGAAALPFLRRDPRQVGVGVGLLALSVAALIELPSADEWTLWSPYQKLTVKPALVELGGEVVPYGHVVHVNSVGYMQITNYSPEFVARHPSAFPADEVPYDHYNAAYRFAERLDEVLIVGAGAGNDAAGALRNGARRVTAVDIDPGVIAIGRELHPERPYWDPRVRVVNDDARSFFKKSADQYDLIVFGLLDSHTLSSSYSNVRLDNYVYTIESFREAGRLLRPEGVMVVLFEIGDPDSFVGARFQSMLVEAFGEPPVGFDVRSGFRGWGGNGFVVGNREVIARRLAGDPVLQAKVQASETTRSRWAAAGAISATDDWPYLYLPGRSIPSLYYVVSALLLLLALAGARLAFRHGAGLPIPSRAAGAVPRPGLVHLSFFFLGAGFMLLEVQNISKLALLFGTTWTVNAVVISAVLAMILLANACAARVHVGSLTPVFIALFATLLANFALPLDILAPLPPVAKELAVGTAMGLPILFAGLIFSTLFASTSHRSTALAYNLLGAMCGGVLESLSFVIGIKALLLLALVLYGVAFLARRLGGAASSSSVRSA
jgi:SAM-dependent methyltransferase